MGAETTIMGTVLSVVFQNEENGYAVLRLVTDDGELLTLLQTLAEVKRSYDKVADALDQVRATGYGIVMPTSEEMRLEVPQIVKKNGS